MRVGGEDLRLTGALMSERYANADWGSESDLAEHRPAGSFRFRDPSRAEPHEAGHAGEQSQGRMAAVGAPYRNGRDFGFVYPGHSQAGDGKGGRLKASLQTGNGIVVLWAATAALASFAVIVVAMS